MGAAKRSSQKPAEVRSPGRIWSCLVLILFLTRYFVPTEGAEEGTTLWIAAAWMGLASVWSWLRCRERLPILPRLNLFDAGVFGLAAGNCLGALSVVLTSGDRRAALNGFWEWTAVAVSWVVLRHFLSFQRVRESCTRNLLVTVLALSCLGIWQYAVTYPRQARELSDLVALRERIESGERLSALEESHYDQLLATWGTTVLQQPPQARQQLLARARDSVEPIGLFALANSFAAVLLVGIILFGDEILNAWKAASPRFTVVIRGVAGLCVLSCFLLTKSRTAYVGLIVGLCCWRLCARKNRRAAAQANSRPWLIVLMTGLAVVVVIGSVWLAGGLDRQVLSEAPKSLQYRLEYWYGTSQVIAHHPLLGTGPGNFRQHYLKYKLPGASEEILDPHNLFLDAWVNGGLIGLLGLMLITGSWIGQLRRRVPVEHSPESSPSTIPATGFSLPDFSCCLAPLLVYICGWLLEGSLDQRLLVLAGGAVVGCALLFPFSRNSSFSRAAACGAAFALLVHLLGAGGLSMPAILQLLLVLRALTFDVNREREIAASRSRRMVGLIPCAALVLLLGCLGTALVPVRIAKSELARGEYELFIRSNARQAEQAFRAAAEADPLSAEPYHRLASLYFGRWQAAGTDDSFQSAIVNARKAIARDPLSAKRYLILSEWFWQHSLRLHDEKSLQAATGAARQGIALYPNFAPLQAQLALSLSAEGDPKSVEVARRAITLDDLNRQAGHTDKVLPEEMRAALASIIVPDDGSE